MITKRKTKAEKKLTKDLRYALNVLRAVVYAERTYEATLDGQETGLTLTQADYQRNESYEVANRLLDANAPSRTARTK